ncbi:protein of unknown function [Shewanella benthica]|uniref:Uncharacterized protein n=1 Tax=Shewanella benthica TaxID=43661 RepID=A0A330LZS8_9GAMM|nr:protein of unknown function [Shewanella benthica]
MFVTRGSNTEHKLARLDLFCRIRVSDRNLAFDCLDNALIRGGDYGYFLASTQPIFYNI